MASNIRIKEDRWFVDYIVDNFKPPEEAIGDRDINVPEGQRLWSWKGKTGTQKQKVLIDSIMNSFPIPGSVVNRVGALRFDVWDGRHRMETMWRYANDKFEWNGKKFSELTSDEKTRFKNREVPVTITDNASRVQLSDMFTRLNSGTPLKDYDYLHGQAETELVKAVYRLVHTHAALAEALALTGGKIKERVNLANWCALVNGLNTENSGNMTTSYIRLSEVLENPIDDMKVKTGLDALAKLYTKANTSFPTTDKVKRGFKNVGKITAFFFADWFAADSDHKDGIIKKWTGIVGRLRGSKEDSMNMKNALATKGAQNLTSERVARVIEQVNAFLYENRSVVASDVYDCDSDDSE
jgi:hypothetical protein